jgi:hypothetical protein
MYEGHSIEDEFVSVLNGSEDTPLERKHSHVGHLGRTVRAPVVRGCSLPPPRTAKERLQCDTT